MPRSYEVQSGPEDSSEAVDYSEGELVSRRAAEDSDSDYDGDRDTRRRHYMLTLHPSLLDGTLCLHRVPTPRHRQ